VLIDLPIQRPATTRKGFSLIEVIIAIAIAGIAFMVLTQTFVNILQTLDSLESKSDREKHIRFVRSVVIAEPELDEFESGDSIETLDFGTATWFADVEPTGVVDLFRANLEIEFDNPDGEPFTYSETLYLLRPTWSDPIERSSLLTDIQQEIEEQARRRDW